MHTMDTIYILSNNGDHWELVRKEITQLGEVLEL